MIICALVVMTVAATPALGDLTIGPDDGLYYTYQKWSFDTDETDLGVSWGPLVPEDYDNPYGDPEATVLITFGDESSGWYGEVDERDGVMSAPDGVVVALLDIPNFADDELYKIVQIEASYQGTLTSLVVGGGTLVSQVVTSTEDGWTDVISTWHIYPQPEFETILLQWEWSELEGGANLDFIEVATVCVPIPAAVILGVLGLAVVGWKLRRFA